MTADAGEVNWAGLLFAAVLLAAMVAAWVVLELFERRGESCTSKR